MKLKNSYILLIAMSIFLLISIGSVCASDATSDASILAEDGDGNSSQIETSVISNDVIVNEKDPKIIPVTVNDNESQPINIKKEDLRVTENNKTINFDYNESIKITDNLNIGNHSLIISYLGNANYTNSSTNIILSIFGNYTMNAPNSVNVNSTKIIEIPLNITNGVYIKTVNPSDFSAELSYKEGNNTTTISLDILDYKNGKLSLSYPLADNITSSTIALVYDGYGERYSKNITLNRIFNVKIEAINNETEYKAGNFTFKLIELDGGNITNKTITLTYSIKAGTITFQQTVSSKTDNKGIVNFKNNDMIIPPINIGYEINTTALEVGLHEVTISSTGMSINNSKQKVSIIKATIDIKIEKFEKYYGTEENVTITLTNAKTGEPVKYEYIHLNMPQTTGKDYYFRTDVEGQSKIKVSQLLPGTYDLTVSNNDTGDINNISVNGNITIKQIPIEFKVVFPSTYYYNTGDFATITVINKNTGKVEPGVIVSVDVYTGKTSKSYIYQSNDKGIINVIYAPASAGSHKVVIDTSSYYEYRYDASAVTKTVTVKKASAKITAPKVTAYYKGGKTFIIKLTNTKNNKVIYGAKVNIKIFISKNRYYNYNAQTGLDGKIRISLDSFKPGTYNVIVSSGESKNFTAKQITTKFVVKKAPAKLTPVKVTAKKGATKYFKVTVKNKKTKKVITGVKVKIKVYTGKSAKTYTVKTNSKGIAQLNVKSLKVGTHKVVVSSGNKYVTAKTAKSSIKITKK